MRGTTLPRPLREGVGGGVRPLDAVSLFTPPPNPLQQGEGEDVAA
jgi:hypothetical protein